MRLRNRGVIQVTSFLFIIALHSIALCLSSSTTTSEISQKIQISSPSINISVKRSLQKQRGTKKTRAFSKKEEHRSNIESIDNKGKKERYLQGLSDLIRTNIFYPRLSKRLRERGNVEVKFTLDKNGRISSLHIVKASPFERLNNAALRTIERLQNYLPLPSSFNSSEIQVFQTIVFD